MSKTIEDVLLSFHELGWVFIRRRLASLKDPREVIADQKALYSGAKLGERTLLPGNDARLGETRFETWLTQSAGTARAAKQEQKN